MSTSYYAHFKQKVILQNKIRQKDDVLEIRY